MLSRLRRKRDTLDDVGSDLGADPRVARPAREAGPPQLVAGYVSRRQSGVRLKVARTERGRVAWETPSYRSVRGSPKCGKALLPPNQVIAEICRPSRVRTIIPYSRAISVRGSRK
jgi:hypothetical protein